MSSIRFSKNDVIYLEHTLVTRMLHRRKTDPAWISAFEAYNADLQNGYLSMTCQPCYGKVLQWVKKQSEQSEQSEQSKQQQDDQDSKIG